MNTTILILTYQISADLNRGFPVSATGLKSGGKYTFMDSTILLVQGRKSIKSIYISVFG